MSNLTVARQLVKPAAGIHPMPGYVLVVFRKIGPTGCSYHSTIPPGKVKPISSLLKSFVAYAVTEDRNILLNFTLPELYSKENVGPFTLSFNLTLEIASPRKIVERLESDPLHKIEIEVCELFRRIARQLSWCKIEDAVNAPPLQFGQWLLDAEVGQDEKGAVSAADFLKHLTGDLGLGLKRVMITFSSPEFGEGVRLVRADEVEKLKAKLERERDRDKALFTREMHDYNALRDRLNHFSDRATGSLARAIEQIAEKVEGVPVLRKALADLRGVQQDVRALFSERASEPGEDDIEAVVSGDPKRFSSPAKQGLEALLQEIVDNFSFLQADSKEKNRLLSSMLHLIAEAALLDDAGADLIEEYSRKLSRQHRRLARQMTDDQRRLLEKLEDGDALRKGLGGE
jgi:hypothetical protein